MLANTTDFGEADVIAVMRHYFSETSTFHGDFGTYFSALTPVFSEHTSSLTIVFFLTRIQCGTPIEISLCYFDNFNHPQRDWPISFGMKYVIYSHEHFNWPYSMWSNLRVAKRWFYYEAD